MSASVRRPFTSGHVGGRNVQSAPARRSPRACAALKSNVEQIASRVQGPLLGALAAAALTFAPLSAQADVAYDTFYGLATPPTSYGGYGGNANEKPKYAFEYPADWKKEVINKREKGVQGVDSRISNPKNKKEQVFVISLGRDGEDNKSFILRDLDQTFQGFVGADYDLQDALQSATETKSGRRDVEGQTFYDYEIDSPDVHYLSSITVKRGKIFALFVKAPTRDWSKDESVLRHIAETFKILEY